VENVHVDSLTSTRKESFPVLLHLNIPPNTGEYKSARIDCLEIASWHLQRQRIGRWHDGDKLSTSLDTPASLLIFRLVRRDL